MRQRGSDLYHPSSFSTLLVKGERRGQAAPQAGSRTNLVCLVPVPAYICPCQRGHLVQAPAQQHQLQLLEQRQSLHRPPLRLPESARCLLSATPLLVDLLVLPVFLTFEQRACLRFGLITTSTNARQELWRRLRGQARRKDAAREGCQKMRAINRSILRLLPTRYAPCVVAAG